MNTQSILLINETALPDNKVLLYPAELDISMIAAFFSLDRTQSQLKKLLESTGFELVQIWTPKEMVPGCGMLFEAVLSCGVETAVFMVSHYTLCRCEGIDGVASPT